MDGIELSREIKTKEAEQHPIVIIISASEWASIEPEAKKAGISKYISKPLFPSAITDRINECLEIEPVASNENQTQANDHFPGKRILLVEDVEINREIVCALLEPTEVTIDCAEDGKIALNKYKADPALYDCIFMDIQMPEMDGYEAARLIRAYESENGLKRRPIIAMTANVFREDIERCLAAGMDGHVGKPLEIEEVLKWLRKYLA
jgi:CheY-like chemotaxis protein